MSAVYFFVMAQRLAILLVSFLVAVTHWAGASVGDALICFAPCAAQSAATDCCAPIPAPTPDIDDCCNAGAPPACDSDDRGSTAPVVTPTCCVRVPGLPLADPTVLNPEHGPSKLRPVFGAIPFAIAPRPFDAGDLITRTAHPPGPPGPPGAVRSMLRSTRLIV